MTKKTYRRKNRLIKFYMDIPEDCGDDEHFAEDLMETMDATDWQVTIQDGDAKVEVNKIVIGDIEIEPEKE